MIQRRQHQVRQPLFRTNGDNRFRFRIDINVIAILIPARNGATQARNTAGGRVAVRIGPLGNGAEFFNDMRRRRAIGLPMLKSIISSPRRRAAIFSSAVILKT
jgi:hypothetical protein